MSQPCGDATRRPPHEWLLNDALRRECPGRDGRVALCPSTIHDRDGESHPPGRFAGTFRAPWWEESRTERVTYCLKCAGLATIMSYFTLDQPSGEVQVWIQAKGL